MERNNKNKIKIKKKKKWEEMLILKSNTTYDK